MNPADTRISVCLAAYNGERFISMQLKSILDQISKDDEVIVVDDYSEDGTIEVVQALNDSRICLVRHSINRGVAATFETAISHASGKVIFLSDQDDLWAPDKVLKMLRIFATHPEATMVVSDAELIDRDGASLGVLYYDVRGEFRPGLWANLLRSKYLGCLMAFRSDLVKRVIPFPLRSDIYHDIWIGVVNSMTSGTTYFLDEPLVFYRRHSETLTGSGLSLKRKIKTRAHLLKAVAVYWTRTLFERGISA